MRYRQEEYEGLLEVLAYSLDCVPYDSNRADGAVLSYHDGLTEMLHRRLYRAVVGPLEDRERLLRTCSTPGCVNPWHREKSLATKVAQGRHRQPYQSNGRPTAAELQRSKTKCPKGHNLTPDNVYTWTDSKGRTHRKCKRCTKSSAQRQREGAQQ